MSKLKVVVTSSFVDDEFMKVANEVLGDIADVVLDPGATEDELIEKCKDADAALAIYDPFTDQRVFAALPKLKLVSLFLSAITSLMRKRRKNTTESLYLCRPIA